MSYFGARYYDPEIGVWGAVDPKKDGYFTYGYVSGNPIMVVDPNGEYGALASALWGGFSSGLALGATGALVGGTIFWATGGDFWDGAKIGGMIGGGLGLAFGGAYGYLANAGGIQIYQGAAGLGKEFRDLTWALPRTMNGSYYGLNILRNGGSVQKIAGQGWLFYGGKLAPKMLGTANGLALSPTMVIVKGTPQLKSGTFWQTIAHEFKHGAQMRKWGPLFDWKYAGDIKKLERVVSMPSLDDFYSKTAKLQNTSYWNSPFETAARAAEWDVGNIMKMQADNFWPATLDPLIF